MKVSVIIVTYRRAWALPYSLSSIASQTRKPDEVIVVLKPSGDGSEEIISKFSSLLPIKLLIQRQGNSTDAYQMAIDCAAGDLVLFIDDDAVAEEVWVEKYVKLFNVLPHVGGVGGAIYKAYIEGSNLRKSNEPFWHRTITKTVFHRRPLPEFSNYMSWLSVSGFMGAKEVLSSEVFKSINLAGTNMGFKKEAIAGCPLAQLYRRSKKGLGFEQLLAYCAKRRGYELYEVLDTQAPTVWHIVHGQSLTRGKGFWHEFWMHYDRVAHYWRLKRLGANVSFIAYLIACIVTLRRKTLPRLLATTYVWFTRV